LKTRLKPFFSEAQTECLVEFAKEAAFDSGFAPVRIRYRLIGSEDLADRTKATAMLQALQSQDWALVARHNALAGRNNLVLGILLSLEGGNGHSVSHWVAMRSPFEILDSPTIIAAGLVTQMPRLELSVLDQARK
jgi:hypothetical protein